MLLERVRPACAAVRVRPALERMARRAGIHGDDAIRFWRIFDLLTRESLDFAQQDGARRFSGICGDGTPWQFCATMGAQAASLRFLTEVGAPGTPLRERTALTLRRMSDVFALIGASGEETIAALADLAPRDDDHIAALWIGVAASSRGPPRVRIYANNGWGELTERWLRLIAALRRLGAGGFAASLQPHLPLLLPAFSPNGFAVTIPARERVCKLYLRPTSPSWRTVRALAPALLSSHGAAFTARIEDGLQQPLETLPDKALIVSVAGPANGGALDLKLDLCGHCIIGDDGRATRMVERLCRAFELDPSPYRDMIEDLGFAQAPLPKEMFAFLGIGGTAKGENRINVYFTAPDTCRTPEP